MTRLIVISNETDLKDETRLVNELFMQGMELFHLRKPFWTLEDQKRFLSSIQPEYLSLISVHQHHETIATFRLKHQHVKESERENCFIHDQVKKSTSFHDIETMSQEKKKWDYSFLSPVFNSISKQDYTGKLDLRQLKPADLSGVYALGGIQKNTIASVFKMGFTGAAVLGAIWKEPGKSLKEFEQLMNLCSQSVHM